jgi:hypothetical protein
LKTRRRERVREGGAGIFQTGGGFALSAKGGFPGGFRAGEPSNRLLPFFPQPDYKSLLFSD